MAVEKKKKTTTKKKKTIIIARGKRKRAIARASVKPGTGLIRINGASLNSFSSGVEKEVISEPMRFVDNKFDAEVSVSGGGVMGQAQAARTAIAKALVATTEDEELRKTMLNYDRTLLVEDIRRVEPKKFKGPKARARFTKSYR